ncbi:MAG: hypothetical protein R2695_04725 [Acidimicrobiales bacterium]
MPEAVHQFHRLRHRRRRRVVAVRGFTVVDGSLSSAPNPRRPARRRWPWHYRRCGRRARRSRRRPRARSRRPRRPGRRCHAGSGPHPNGIVAIDLVVMSPP